MRTDPLLQLVNAVLTDLKAIDITTLNVQAHTTVTDYMVIATGNSGRHVQALADKLHLALEIQEHPPEGIEGDRDQEWILLDLGSVVVHLMQKETREYYQLEKLWAPRWQVPEAPSTFSMAR